MKGINVRSDISYFTLLTSDSTRTKTQYWYVTKNSFYSTHMARIGSKGTTQNCKNCIYALTFFALHTGNMWAQSWTNIARFVMPFPEMPDFDVTDSMHENVRDPAIVLPCSADLLRFATFCTWNNLYSVVMSIRSIIAFSVKCLLGNVTKYWEDNDTEGKQGT